MEPRPWDALRHDPRWRRSGPDQKRGWTDGHLHDARWHSVLAVAASQSGLVTRKQALDAGYPEHAWDYRVRAEHVIPVQRGLYEVSPPSNEALRRCTAALLTAGEGAVLSHRSAAKLHRLWGIDGFPVELTVPRRLARNPLPLTVHRGTVPPSEQERVHQLPVTSILRTVTDLAPLVEMVGLAGLVESARRRHREFIPRLNARVALVHPREAQQRLEWVLEDAARRSRPMDSMFEIEFWHRWLLTGLPTPVPQYEVWDPEGRRFYVDFAWPEAKVALETQGYETRQTSDSFDKDSRRTSRLIALGWIVIPISHSFFRRDFLGVMNVVRQALHQRRDPHPSRPRS